MLKLENVQVTFNRGTLDERHALDHVSLEFAPGDFVTVIGSNGAGKSTLLNAVAGSIPTDGGRILLDGMDLTRKPEYTRAKYIGRLFQDPLKGTAPHMTIEENLGLAYCRGSRRGFGRGIKKADQTFFREQLAALHLGLEDRLKTNVGLLSGGQRQALTLLMATIVTPKLLLLDEHTAALDPKTALQVMKLTDEIVKKNNITTIMITHNIKNALEYGNKTLVLNQGSVLLELAGREREEMTVEKLLEVYSASADDVPSDRMLL